MPCGLPSSSSPAHEKSGILHVELSTSGVGLWFSCRSPDVSGIGEEIALELDGDDTDERE